VKRRNIANAGEVRCPFPFRKKRIRFEVRGQFLQEVPREGTMAVSLIRQLHRLALCDQGGGISDGQLLELFINRQDEAAFAALVKRHGSMVLGVCRRVLHNMQDAEDAFQATFLVLVRKAASIKPPDMVGNWLHGVAYRTALKARSTAAKRRAREMRPRERHDPGPDDAIWRELVPILDRELHRLPDKYRLPIVLCDLEGKSCREAARRLDWPLGTLTTRLVRGRKLLARKLSRHGTTLSAGALASLVTQNTASACVPVALASSTVKAASAATSALAGASGLISPAIARLTEGMVHVMFVNKLKAVFGVVLVLAMGGMGARYLAQSLQAADAPTNQTPATPKAVTGPIPVAPALEHNDHDLEELLYEMLRKDGRIIHPGWRYEIFVRRVQGRALLGLQVFRRSDSGKSYDAIMRASSGEIKVDMTKRQILLPMEDVRMVDASGNPAYFEKKVWLIDLPQGFDTKEAKRNRGRAPARTAPKTAAKKVKSFTVEFEVLAIGPDREDLLSRPVVAMLEDQVAVVAVGSTAQEVSPTGANECRLQCKINVKDAGLLSVEIVFVNATSTNEDDVPRIDLRETRTTRLVKPGKWLTVDQKGSDGCLCRVKARVIQIVQSVEAPPEEVLFSIHEKDKLPVLRPNQEKPK
jgi:RNA polymerase sigma factor (sigma-70 family)